MQQKLHPELADLPYSPWRHPSISYVCYLYSCLKVSA